MLAPKAIFTGMTSSDQVWHDVANNIEVLSLPVSMMTRIKCIKRLRMQAIH
ncbi:hypothetical protein [Dickeya dianthicola]|nr:hypothetical protein DDI_2065 [Dickeya dianthicola RNS04.9]MBT1428199.1 hypothetical protein [Dickeya dianthicola]MBT1432267.1 hypothetical protein [Dickeya dianthicola]MBT1459713.1 hypothetical protein [Dickeya dianthicola]MBT1488912.1 hypothetical protein [Dickeya dianthicola]